MSEPQAGAPAPKPVLLVVDDEAQVLSSIERDLRSRYGKDYRIVKASSGAEGLELARRLRDKHSALALFLSDQRMPGMGGTEFLAQAKAIFPEAKKVLLTAYADTQAAIAAINEVGVDYYLMKPWDPPDRQLYPLLDDLLGDWAATAHRPWDGIRVVGALWSPRSYEVKEFLSRNQIPYRWLDVDRDEEARTLFDKAGGDGASLPLVVLTDGKTLTAPAPAALAEAMGLRTAAARPFYDLVIVGAGPAGLAAAVYGGSEGLSTLMIEKKAPGGQAGSSSFIENYLGFPKGLSGDDLARRATAQVQRFGVEIVSRGVTSVRVAEPFRVVVLDDGTEVSCKAVVLATGMATRMLDRPGVERFTGRGVFYGASLTEAVLYKGQDMFVVGGANSAGQGALFFARHARKVTLLIRGDSIEAGMSHYLVQQLRALDNVEILVRTEIAEVHGDDKLDAVTLLDRDGKTDKRPAGAVFIFIGTAPHSEAVRELVRCDDHGFIVTGADLLTAGKRPPGWQPDRDPLPLETSVPGIFAAGDIRAGTMKRVASAVGEGAHAVALVHQYLRTV